MCGTLASSAFIHGSTGLLAPSYQPVRKLREPSQLGLRTILLGMANQFAHAAVVFSGQNDAAVIFRSSAGGRRWQFAENVSQQQLNLRHYTVILGSHRNSCLKIERNGQDVFSVRTLTRHILSKESSAS